ncbi:hypothetical protein BO71DRAFT_419371 [Aspergillus ellipticus CBS 707.79]|uniref:Uncharacterized protein n=1 Tax=Aspergillus ellipticus CBS 707.79 TaxID=1448320 RepID=A0A319DB11_9EURO|nr:hypothetical protein BO71DRAFT_419371 [Aspergillus ellipticus CBS 707.79]
MVKAPLTTKPRGHPLAAYSKTESYLLEYFIEGIGPNCSQSRNHNPYITHIVPLSFCHSPLRNALLAVAGNQLRLLRDTRFVKQALMYKGQALSVMATVLMLCFHATFHHAPSACGSDPLRKFVEMYFVAHETMSRTGSQSPISEGGKCTWSDVNDLDEIDPVMGCSRRLMSLIDDISHLPLNIMDTSNPNNCHRNPNDIDMAAKVAEIHSSLKDLTQNTTITSREGKKLANIAETKRVAALVYLIERVNLTPINSQFKFATSAKKNRMIATIIRLKSNLPDTPILLWPLYIIGHARLVDDHQRRFILDRLQLMQRTRNLGSVRRTRTAVKRAFQVFDIKYSLDHTWGDNGIVPISLA